MRLAHLRTFVSRRLVRMAIAAGVLATLALTVANTVTAHDDGGRGGCNAASLRGDYGLLFSGVAVEDPQLPAGMTVGTGVRTYHGNGTFDQLDNEHFQFFGEPIHNRRATGTYTVFTGTPPVSAKAAEAYFEIDDATCRTSSSAFALTGTITVTSVTDPKQATFDLMFPNSEHVTGSYNALSCTALDPNSTPLGGC